MKMETVLKMAETLTLMPRRANILEIVENGRNVDYLMNVGIEIGNGVEDG